MEELLFIKTQICLHGKYPFRISMALLIRPDCIQWIARTNSWKIPESIRFPPATVTRRGRLALSGVVSTHWKHKAKTFTADSGSNPGVSISQFPHSHDHTWLSFPVTHFFFFELPISWLGGFSLSLFFPWPSPTSSNSRDVLYSLLSGNRKWWPQETYWSNFPLFSPVY